jgi:endonuclease III
MRKYTNQSFGALIEAASRPNDEFKNDVAPITNPIVKAALEEQKAGQLKEVKDQILQALDHAKCIRDDGVTNIRHLRKQVDQTKAKLDLLDRAEEHGKKTGDFRPLLVVMGQNVEGFDVAGWKV